MIQTSGLLIGKQGENGNRKILVLISETMSGGGDLFGLMSMRFVMMY
jgi:hypothetical protein